MILRLPPLAQQSFLRESNVFHDEGGRYSGEKRRRRSVSLGASNIARTSD